MNSIFHVPRFFINSGHILDILRAKKWIDFSPPFNPFFSVRPTSESYNGPLKVVPEGSVVEYLPVGSQEAPKTIIGQKKPQTHIELALVSNIFHSYLGHKKRTFASLYDRAGVCTIRTLINNDQNYLRIGTEA